MPIPRLDDLIDFHRTALANNRVWLHPATIVLFEETIKSLEELKSLKGGKE